MTRPTDSATGTARGRVRSIKDDADSGARVGVGGRISDVIDIDRSVVTTVCIGGDINRDRNSEQT